MARLASDMGRTSERRADVSTWISHEVTARILAEVLARCAEAGVPILVVKGVVTSRLLYDDVAQRAIADIDVRIRPSDFSTFRALAAKAGWRCLRVAWTYRNLVYDFPPLSLDVEGYVGAPGLCAMTVDEMLSRATPLEIAPTLRVLVPEIHDHAVVLAVNAFKDKIVAANRGALSDVERIVLHRDFRCHVFVDRVVHSRIATLAWIVAAWMESERQNNEWGAIRVAIEARAPVRRRYGNLFRRLITRSPSTAMSLRLLARAVADRPLMQAEAIVCACAWEAEMWLRGRDSAR